jgi:hypothetical protein
MTDERLDELINKARDTYRVAPEPPLDAMWADIEPELPAQVPDISPRHRRGSPWSVVGYAAAAALVLGIGLGRWSATRPSPAEVATAAAPETGGLVRPIAYVGEPLQRTTTNYLGEAEALLRSLQRGTNGANGTYASQAAVLLMQTRLLLDSPAASDSRLRDLLEDLELALLQIAALKGVDDSKRRAEELNFIRNALDEREMVPRLRTAVVTLASYED